MDFMELASTRYSVRDFQERPIEEDKLETIIAAGRVAPTARNIQPQRIYILKSREALATIRSLTRCAFNAPVVLLFAYDEQEEWKNPLEEGIRSGIEDVSIVATHMMLAAWELGIGSCWVNYFPNTETARRFGLPAHEKPVLLMPLGYPSEKAAPTANHSTFRPDSDIIRIR